MTLETVKKNKRLGETMLQMGYERQLQFASKQNEKAVFLFCKKI